MNALTLMLPPGAVKRIIDGDTFLLHHVGVPPEERVRLLGVDTPEKNEPKAAEATQFTESWLKAGPFELLISKRDSFGRILAEVSRNGEHLSQSLKDAGLGK